MANKAEIGWTRVNEEGVKLDVYARLVGRKWEFFARARRYHQWQAIPEPLLEDWLELLDAIRRLVTRRRYQPDDEQRLVATIRERFPEWQEE
jgi:hypothetical protein